MVEQYGFYLLILGAVLGATGSLWLLVVAFKERLLWGLALLLFPPAAVLFVPLHLRKAAGPLAVLLLAGVVFAAPYGLSYYQRHYVKLGPHERVVDGELRITLTGLTGFDYSSLQTRRETVVLQMANEDVDDRTLEYLRGMDRLRTLDLNGARVTDEGLRVLAELPRLQELRLARTKITDEGFQKYLGPKESLRKVDLTGTGVKGKTKRDWKKRKPEEREFVD
jgi:hypothetical protein